MNLAIGSSYVACASTNTEGSLQRKNGNSTKSYVRIGGYLKNGNSQETRCNDKRVAISSQLMPGHLEDSLIGKKQKPEKPSKMLQFVRTLLIDNYDSYTYNIYQQLSVINGVPPVVIRNDEWTWDELCYYLNEERAFDNIVISPGPGSPDCDSDIGLCLRILHECKDIPILGVCLGHQALGHVHGAKIVHACEPVHGRLSEIMHNGCKLFHDIPSGPESGFKVVRYHSLVIDPESLPNDLVPIAWTSSTSTLSFYDSQNLDHIPDSSKNHINPNLSFNTFPNGLNGKSGSYSLSKQMQKGEVLMGIMHATRPHYGVQRALQPVMGGKYSRISGQLRKIFGINQGQQSLMEKVSNMPVSGSSSLFRVLTNGHLVCAEDVRIATEVSTRTQFLGHVKEENPFHTSKILDSSESSIGIRKLKLKLTWRKYNQMAKKVGGARNVFYKLFGQNKAQDTFWLDSSSVEKKRARFSFMGGKGGSLWKQMTFKLSEKSDMAFKGGGYLSFEDAQGNKRSTLLEKGFLDFLNQELQSFSYDDKDFEGLPFEFYGGYVGYIGYNLKVECGMSSNRHKSRTPDACFFFIDNFLVFDHHNDDVYVMSVREGNMAADSWLDDVEAKLLSLESSLPKNLRVQTYQSTTFSPCDEGFILERSRDQYINDVQKCLDYIKDGQSYELCFTTQMRKRIEDIDSLGLYLHLREKNPAPYAAWLNFSNENLCICCSSPERFLRLDRNGVLEAKPIKGTIARGSTEQEDEQLKLQLQYSEKDQAENLMIVDLLRNDLGRVCEPGSVHVPHLMDVESYATVHTMVSTIRGSKRSNMNAVDCIRAAFPGGSMTGAPKLRSMEILDSLESCSRGIYSGSIGFISYNQTFDLNIVIRTIVIHEDEASIGAGGAIVALSDPKAEFNEMLLKTRAPVKAMTEFQSDEERNS